MIINVFSDSLKTVVVPKYLAAVNLALAARERSVP